MNVLGRHVFYDFPQYYNIFSRRTADAGVATVHNTNSRFLDGYEGADGIKTGYTGAAGFNLTASARRGNKHIIATVFGGTSTANRNAKMVELMDLGFGEAKNRVKEQPPVAPDPLPSDALIASAEPEIDEIDAEGGAGKTVRVSGGVTTSPRPKARPGVPAGAATRSGRQRVGGKGVQRLQQARARRAVDCLERLHQPQRPGLLPGAGAAEELVAQIFRRDVLR